MTLEAFLRETQTEVRDVVAESDGAAAPEAVFAEIVTAHMAEVGITQDPQPCHVERRMGSAVLRLSGYAVSDDADELDLFVSLYDGVDEPTPVPESELKHAVEQCLRFLTACVEGRIGVNEPDENVGVFAATVRDAYPSLDQIRVFVLTDRVARTRHFKAREVAGRSVRLEVMDIERLYRHWAEGKPRDELVVDFRQICGAPLPCVYVPGGETGEYDYALTAVPGAALAHLYDRYGARLLEANVRSFLSQTGKVNQGIRDTLREFPDRFMAYNNGVVLVADDAEFSRAADGGAGLLWLKGMQIVNGGQTTASLYFTKKKDPKTDLSRVRVPAKIIVLRSADAEAEEALIGDISKYANSQNVVKASDLSANKPFHVELEKLSLSTWSPDGQGRWFYERASGSYNVMLMREGSTPARLRRLKDQIPSSRRVTKTDMARYLNAWALRPDIVSQGAQKNFDRFMLDIRATENLPDLAQYKTMIARAIIYKAAEKLIRSSFRAFAANITAYTVAVLAERLGAHLSLEQVWQAQDISQELRSQILTWALEVDEALKRFAGERMISEAAKKPECWQSVLATPFSAPADDIPELTIKSFAAA